MSPDLARRLPDLPRWVEVRDLLWGGDGEVCGDTGGASFVVVDPGPGTVFVVGDPLEAVIRAALRPGAELIAGHEQADRMARLLPDRVLDPILVHVRPESAPLAIEQGDVGFLDLGSLAPLSLPEELARELAAAAEHTRICAAFDGGRPVSFCYAGATTEAWWDVAIDTLAAYRRRGFASACVSAMIEHMRAEHRRPVWQAAGSNPPSWKMAAKLGFVHVDTLVSFPA